MAHNELSLSSLCSLLLLSFFFFLWPTLWILSLFPGLTEWVWPEFCLVEKMMVVKPLTVRLTDWQLAWPPANWTRNTTIDLLKESMPKSFCCYSSPNFDLFKEKYDPSWELQQPFADFDLRLFKTPFFIWIDCIMGMKWHPQDHA